MLGFKLYCLVKRTVYETKIWLIYPIIQDKPDNNGKCVGYDFTLNLQFWKCIRQNFRNNNI